MNEENALHIASLNQQKRQLFQDFYFEVTALGWNIIITQSYRSIAYQNMLHRKDLRNAIGGLSAHNYGFAIDINCTKGNLHLKKDSTAKEWIDSGIVAIAKKHGLRWGGDFNNYFDPIHFDCVKPNLTAKWYNKIKGLYPKDFESKETNKMDWQF